MKGKINALTVPRWGMAMEEGTLVNWLVDEGDAVKEGDDVAELESSKIVNVLQTHSAGTLKRRLAREGDTLPVGALLGVVADPAATEDEVEQFIRQFTPARLAASTDAPRPVAGTDPAPPGAPASAGPGENPVPDSLREGPDDSAVSATPGARRVARQLGINLNNVKGTGRNGRVSEADLERALLEAGGAPARPRPQSRDPAPAGAPKAPEALPLDGMRLTIAKRLSESKRNIPHFRLVADACVDALLAHRATLAGSDAGVKISVNDMLVKACAAALMAVPECNIQFDGETIHRYQDVDISVAVALDEGLMTPVVRQANRKGLSAISAEIRRLITGARAGTLKHGEYSGGTFTLSNLGMFGIRQFDAIINPPQAAILAVGRAEPRVLARDGKPAVATMMTLSLSCDHRVIDGVLGARFMDALVGIIEAPRDHMATA